MFENNLNGVENTTTKKILYVFLGVLAVAIVVVSVYLIKPDTKDEKYLSVVGGAGSKFDAGDVSGSIVDLETYLESNLSDPIRAGVLLSLASAYAQKGSLEFKEIEYGQKAINSVNESLKLVPDISEAYRIMAYAYEIQQDYTNAVSNYEKAISLDNHNASALTGLGHAYDLMGDLTKAKENYEKALMIEPNLDYALYNMAKISFNLGKLDDAELYAKKVIDASTNNRFISETKGLQGLISQRKSDYTGAVLLFEGAIASDPTLEHNYVFLANAKLSEYSQRFNEPGEDFENSSKKILSDASSLVEKALSLNPNLTAAYILEGRINFLKRDKDAMKKSFSQALSVLPDDISLGADQKKNVGIQINDYIINYSNLI